MRAPAGCSDHLSARRSDTTNGRDADLTVRNPHGEFLDSSSGRAVDGDTAHTARMPIVPTTHEIRCVLPTANHVRVVGERV
jgi:hypothetical protein